MRKYILCLVTCFVFGTCLTIGERKIRVKNLHVRDTPLGHAVSENNIEEVKNLILKGVSLDEMNNIGETPLMIAAEDGNIEIINLLLKAGANINVAGPHGTALSVAARRNQLNAMRLLIKLGSEINRGDDFTQHTPLMQASMEGHLQVMKELLAQGADPNLRDTLANASALYWAVAWGGKEAVLLLLQDPRVNVHDRCRMDSDTALHIAVEKNNYDMVRFLILHNADLSLKNRYGQKPIDVAKNDEMKAFLQSIKQKIIQEEVKAVQTMFGGTKRKLDIFHSIRESLGHSSEEYA